MKKTLQVAVILVWGIHAEGQGTFQNLDFESANVTGDHVGSLVSTSSAFPYWQAFVGTTPSTQVGYDAISIGAPLISIADDYPPYGLVPIQGNYNAWLMAAKIAAESFSVTLSQTAVVPSDTESIQLDAHQASGSSFVVTLDGQAINMVPLQNLQGYTLYGGNISAWSGQNATLSITEMPPANQMYSPSLLELDNITFSPTAVVPEPTSFALMGIGGLLFAGYRRFAPKRA